MTGKMAQPTRLEVLLLQAGVWEPKRAREAWEKFCGQIDDVEVLDVGLYGLFPILAANLEEFGSTLPHADYYQSSLRHSWAKSHRLLSLILPVLRGLKEGGIDYLLLRGVALSYSYYGHGGARPNIDLGLLLRPAQVVKTFQLLLRLGCKPKTPIRPEDEAALIRYGYESVWLLPNQLEFRVRWHLVQGCLHEAGDARVWQEAQDCPLPGLPARTPGTVDQFIEICLADYHGAYLPRLADAAMVLREGKPDWTALESSARRLQRLEPVREMILELARLELGVAADVASHWREVRIGELERMEQEAVAPAPRWRIKAAALAYLRLNLGGDSRNLWQNLAGYAKHRRELRGMPRRVALIPYILRWRNLFT